MSRFQLESDPIDRIVSVEEASMEQSDDSELSSDLESIFSVAYGTGAWRGNPDPLVCAEYGFAVFAEAARGGAVIPSGVMLLPARLE